MLLGHRMYNPQHPDMKTEGRWLGESFDDFLKNIPKEHLLNQLYMFSSNFDVGEAFHNIATCSHFFFVDQFSLGISQLSSKLGVDLQEFRARSASMDVDIHQEELSRLRDKLEPEYFLIEQLRKVYEGR
jgi:hypothetical protein